MSHKPESYPISSNSRTKLNAFRFNERAEQSPEKSPSKSQLKPGHANKENQASWLNGALAPPQPKPGMGNPPGHVKESNPPKASPHTPANRIPLADLISSTEDAVIQDPTVDITPEDHVIWQHVPASSNTDGKSHTPATSGKKRRHSSSPTFSPSTDRTKSARKEPFDLQSFQALLKTPQTDIAADLWNNYVEKHKSNGNGDIQLPRFESLLASSPQTPASAKVSRDSSGLRRSISCNAEWPTSGVKRRKVDGEDSKTPRGLFSRTTSNVLDSGKSKSSRLNFLLEKIEKSLQKPTDDPSSSPVPENKDEARSRSSSPIERRTLRASEKSHQTDDDDQPSKDQGRPHGSSSEFEDDELDQDLLDFAAASMDPFVDTKESHNSIETSGSGGGPGFASKDDQPSLPAPEHPSANPTSPDPKPNTINQNDANEFDEFDDDYDDEGMEEIIAEYDKTSGSNIPRDTAGHDQSAPEPAALDGAEPPKGAEKGQGMSSGDEFDDDDFDVEAIEQSMNQAEAGSNHSLRSRQAIKRYQIVDIAESTYVTHKGRTQPEQVLLVKDEKIKQQKVAVLRESWFDSPCSKESYIHLIGDFDAAGQCVVDDSHNMIILHPDHLISATVVADSISCQRRAVLQDRVKAFGELGRPQVFGVIFHEIFQEAMKANRWDLDSLRALVESILTRHIEELYVIHMSVWEAIEYVMNKIPVLKAWADAFLRVKPNGESYVEDRHNSKFNLSISKLLEVEEHIWSPMYGLKGNIDATVQIACREGESDKNLVVPLELKTGNKDTNQAHRAQTALYTLLLSDRYDLDVNFGLLYYLEISKTLRIRGIRHELLQMIQERNRLAGYVRERMQLPPMIKKPRLCNQCYAKTPCLIYHKLSEDGDGETSGLGNDFTNAVGHLNDNHRDFFRKWDNLLTKEEQTAMRFRRELWTLLSSEREFLGRCFGNVVIEAGSAQEDKDDIKINRYRYTFIKKQSPSPFSFTESQITVGEPIVVSDEKGHFALANGYVVQVIPKRITVAVDRRLHNARNKAPGFDSEHNQTFRGIMEVFEEGTPQSTANPHEPEEEIIYRLDKDEFSNGMAIVRNNIVSMMEKNLFQAQQLRRLIVEKEAPTFKSPSSTYQLPDSEKASLNIDQKCAIDKVMSARDYALVLGMPGTGKTTTIAHIIRALVAQGKSVLLTSYTHTAVDNILLKIREDNIRILRIGAPAKVHPDVQQFVDLAAVPKKTIEELKGTYEDSQVVATTCLGVNHNIFNRRIFDYCIVDEASQITLPVCLGPIRMARTFILVGDHYQLPPLVQNKEAQEGGLDISLFKLLSDYHPSSVVNLEHQYRMCEEIMLLSNNLIYSGHLKCGTPEVASRSLEIPNMGGLRQHHIDHITHSPTRRQLCLGTSQGRCWLRDLVNPAAKTCLVNTDTTATSPLEIANGMRVVNPTESTLCAQLVESFISCGVPARNIGVITFYRSQLSLLKQNLRHHLPDLEMHTTDKFQGRDKEIVILSCVRSNSEKNVGELLRDWRRVNVAFTRARTKLLVVGSKSTLRDGNELLGKYVDLMENHGWVYDLPKGAAENHLFDSLDPPQTQSQTQSQNQLVRSSPSPKKGSPRSKPPRSPLGELNGSNGLRKPAKKGAKLSPGSNRVIGNRPVLRDVMNDLIG